MAHQTCECRANGAFVTPRLLPREAHLSHHAPVTKSELIEAIAARGGLTKARAEEVVNSLFEAMTAALRRGEGIELRGFGSFSVREYKGYDGRNPLTGTAVAVPPKRLPFFRPGKDLRELVDQSRLGGPITGED
ncbi:MAG: integration host factor subunit beta [Polyangiaceae bacterium]|nr:integration host factor subunit beta [Polyangiaceae bacterium]